MSTRVHMYIVVADALPASALQILHAEGWSVDATPDRTVAELSEVLRQADALIVRSATRVTADLMAAAPELRVIARAGSGIDTIDLAAARARGIPVLYAPGATISSVAELAVALMLALARRIPAADQSMKAGRWEKQAFEGTELAGKTLGLVGFGRIGRRVAVLARAFDMHVVVHDPGIASGEVESGVSVLDLDALCGCADYISLHAPGGAATRHMFDASRLAACRPGVRIVNTARGSLIDGPALYAALDSGRVAGAGLDVFEQEPPADMRLVRHPAVVTCPHMGASTSEAQERVGLEIAAAVRDFLRDGRLTNAVP